MIDSKTFVDEFSNKPSGMTVQFATVDLAYSSGNPKLTFDGEANLSQKAYPHMESFTPLGGERVMLINGVIVGKIKQY